MKKYLYGTTALAAVGLAAGPVAAAEALHYELGGFYQQFFGFTDEDIGGTGEEISYQNAEIFFKMRGELDNGLKIGGRLELEGENGGDQIDQAYLTLAGGFGSLRLGAINSGRYSYGWNTDAPNVGVPINSGWASTWMTVNNASGFRFRSVALSTVIDGSNDEQKITYFTPRFNGFQLTGSWTPEGHIMSSSSVGQGGESFGANTGISSDATQYTNGWDFGLSYSGGWNDVGVEVQAGIGGASAPTDAEALGFDDYLAFNGGVGISFGGFTVAGSFAVIDEGLALAGGAQSNEGQAYNVGASYSSGPWAVSATYFNGQEESVIANPGDEENEIFAIAAAYTLGPGLKTSITVLRGDMKDDLAGSAGDNDATAVLLGIHAGF